jgi:hypothetical protein
MNSLVKQTSRVRIPQVFLAPVLIGLLVLSGLLSGLSSSGFGRYFSWLSVGSPLAVNFWVYLQRFRKSSFLVVPDK